MNNKTLLWSIVAVAVIVAVVLFINNDATAPTNNTQEVDNTGANGTSELTENENQTPPPGPAPATDIDPQTYTITMTDSGYAPASLEIKKGDTVTFVNNGTKANWPASAPHPTHTDYPEFDPKKGIAVGESWSFTFDRAGTWRFHDHLNPTRFGSITVAE